MSRSLDRGNLGFGIFYPSARIAVLVVRDRSDSQRLLSSHNNDVSLPQLNIIAAAARVKKPDTGNNFGPHFPIGGATFGLRKRDDGGYTVGPRNINIGPHHTRQLSLPGRFPPGFHEKLARTETSMWKRFLRRAHDKTALEP